jgi:hypothetical protein
MSEEQQPNPPSIRSQAGEDDARLEARMKAIMEKQTTTPKGRSSNSGGNPDWLKNKPKAKAAPEVTSEKPARKAKPKAPAVKPPKNSEESWRLAAEYIARKEAGDE